MFFKGIIVVSALLFCIVSQASHVLSSEPDTSTGSVSVESQEDPMPTTTPLITDEYKMSRWLELFEKLEKLEKLKKLEKCYQETILICDKEYEQCCKEPEIKHQGLNACLEIKFDCLKTCKRDCNICCKSDGTPECSSDCRSAQRSCEKECESEGTSCTMRAMMGKPVKPIDNDCEEQLEQCEKVVEELCFEGL